MQGAFITHRGKVYDHNEDACFIEQAFFGEGMGQAESAVFKTEGSCVAVVADGIGGNSAGETASKLVVESFSDSDFANQEGLVEHLKSVNHQLYKKGQADPDLAGMGATVVGLCFGASEIFAFNVGDARVYRKQDDYLMQITKDDSIAQVLVDAGELSMDETRDKKLHQITQAIGGATEEKEIDPHTYPIKISNQASFLICSDGLHDMVSLDEIEAIVAKENSPINRVDGLFQAALKNGGEDNITIIWIDVDRVSLRTELCGKKLVVTTSEGKTEILDFKSDTVSTGEGEASYKVQGQTVLLSETDEQIEFEDEYGVSIGDELIFKGQGNTICKSQVTDII